LNLVPKLSERISKRESIFDLLFFKFRFAGFTECEAAQQRRHCASAQRDEALGVRSADGVVIDYTSQMMTS
jgi:hypothetical protein